MISARLQSSIQTELNRLDKHAEKEQARIASHQMKLDGINAERSRLLGILGPTAHAGDDALTKDGGSA